MSLAELVNDPKHLDKIFPDCTTSKDDNDIDVNEIFAMTFKRTGIDSEGQHIGSGNNGSSFLHSSEKGTNADQLLDIRELILQNGMLNTKDEAMVLIDLLSHSLCDDKSSTRTLALELLRDIMPLYGKQLDTDIGLLFPQLLQNLLHSECVITQNTLEVVNLYYEYCSNKDVALNYLIHHGLNNDVKALRNEVLLLIPSIVKLSFSESQLQRLFCSLMDCSNKMGIEESNLHLIISLEHIKNSMGEKHFQKFLKTLNVNIAAKYAQIMKPADYSEQGRQEELVFGFLPAYIIENLKSEKSWHTRSDAVTEFLNIVTTSNGYHKITLNCRDLFDYIQNLVDDVNFSVALTSLHVLHQVIVKLGQDSKLHLDVIMRILLKKLSDSKVAVRKINLHIGMSLMHTLTPSVFLQAILPLLKHKNARVREEVINMITASLLSFPSSEFNLQNMPQLLGFTLLDKSKKVRHSSLECFAILAQQLGPRKLSPLVSAIDVLERKNNNADGLLRAVQTRLNRRMLPKINDDGLVQYSLRIPANSSGNTAADVAWILAASNGRVDTARSTQSGDQETNELTERRLFSAGRNKLPWENENYSNTERKKVGSAPVRSLISPNGGSQLTGGSPTEIIPKNDTWVSQKTSTSSGNEKGNSDGKSYFQFYKNKMRRIKEAGLKADRNILKSHLKNEKQTYGQYGNNFHEETINTNNPLYSEKAANEQSSPLPLKPKLARSASKKRLEKMLEQKTNTMEPDVPLKSDSSLAHTLPKMKGGLLHKLSSTELNEINSMNEMRSRNESPFPSKPSLLRSPSGSLSFHTQGNPIMEETNLIQMKKFSNSSPAVFDKSFSQKTPLAPVQHFGRLDAISPSPSAVDSSRIRSRSISPIDRLDYKSMNEIHHKIDERRGNQSPKLSKSAQEKLRKFKELKTRNSIESFDPHSDSPNEVFSDSYSIDYHSIVNSEKTHEVDIKKNGQYGYSNNYSESNFIPHKPKEPGNTLQDMDKVCYANTKNSKSFSLDINHHSLHASPRIKNNCHPKENHSNQSLKQKELTSSKVVHSPPACRKVVYSPPIVAEMITANPDHNNNHNNESVKSPENVGVKIKKSPRGVPSKATNSPKERKLRTRKSFQWDDETKEYPTEPQKCYSSSDIDKPLDNAAGTLDTALEMLKGSAEEWETKLDALILLRRLLCNHAEEFSEIHPVVVAVLTEVKNLRSQVTRSALSCIGDIFKFTPKMVELELDLILKTVLPKAGDTNQFIRADTESAINSLVENVNPSKAMASIIATGVEHRNGSVRSACAKALADLAEAVGPAKFCQTKMNVAVAGRLAVDPQPDSRYHGRRMLFLILNQPDLDDVLEKYLQPSNLKPVRDVVETLKTKGLEPSTGSATVRRSTRNGSSFTASPASTRKSRRGDASTRSSKNKGSANGVKKAQPNNGENKEGLGFLDKLNSNVWTDRYEALDHLYDSVSETPSLVAHHISKVVDYLVPRLHDPNSKVNVYALQTLNRCLPPLENSLPIVISILVDGLKPPLASKNDAIYNAARQCLSTLAKYVDNFILVKPIINAVQHGNMRIKPDYVLLLSELTPPLYNKKPGVITRQVLPFLWELLSTSVSGVISANRPTFQQAVAKLSLTLHECLGEELKEEAESKPARVSQRLKAILDAK